MPRKLFLNPYAASWGKQIFKFRLAAPHPAPPSGSSLAANCGHALVAARARGRRVCNCQLVTRPIKLGAGAVAAAPVATRLVQSLLLPNLARQESLR